MIVLTSAPRHKPLRIVEIIGGHGVRWRLIALGLNKDDIIELDSRSIPGGAVLVRNLTMDVSVALGRGVAKKIMVEIIDEQQ
jgi:Fe2+ transport system protein FeoA